MIGLININQKLTKYNISVLTPILCGVMVLTITYSPHLILTLFALGLCLFLLYCLFTNQVPVFLKRIANRKGEKIPLEQFQKHYPLLATVGICGNGAVGKSTLVDAITGSDPLDEFTQKITAKIFEVRNDKNNFYALIDGSGQNPAHQSDIIRYSDYLIIMVDHNIRYADKDIKVIKKRVLQNLAFIDSVKEVLKGIKIKPAKICIVLNKKDLWSQYNREDVEVFKKQIQSAKEDLSKSLKNTDVLSYELDSTDTRDVPKFLTFLNL